MDAPREQSKSAHPYKRGLQICALTMLAALGAGFWGYLVQPAPVFFIVTVAALGGTFCIAALVFAYFEDRRDK